MNTVNSIAGECKSADPHGLAITVEVNFRGLLVKVRFLGTCWVNLNELSRRPILAPVRKPVKHSGSRVSFPTVG